MWAKFTSFQSRRCVTPVCLASATTLMLALWAASPVSADDKFSLAGAIPDNVFIASIARHNPEREFLETYWNEVWEAFKQSGVIDDGLELALSNLDDEQKAEVNRLKDRFSELIRAGDWKALGSGQFAFGERLPKAMRNGNNVSVGTPDIVVMFRTTDAIAQKNFKALSDILRAVVEEISTAANTQLELDERTRNGAELISLNLTQKAPQAPPMPITIGRRGDTILLTMGATMCDEVVDLLAGKSTGKAISDSPRFKQAFAQLGPAEDAMIFFDMKNLRRDLENIFDGVFAAISSKVDDDITNARLDPKSNELVAQALAAYQQGEYAAALKLTRAAYEVSPKDSIVLYNLACFSALTGEKTDALSWLEKAVEAGFHAPQKIAGDDDLKSLHDEPRYQAALESAGQMVGGQTKVWSELAHSVADTLLKTLGVFDYSATIERTDGYSTYTDSIAVLAADAERNPIYPVFGNRKPIADFAKYLPQETVSFSANNGIALDELYSFIEQVFNEAGLPGKQAWTAWTELQATVGFDVRNDLLSWLDTGTVSAGFQIAGRDEWMFMIKVKDEDAAREKLALALKFAADKLGELAATNPALFMLVPRTEPTANEKLAGFHDVAFGMMPAPAVCGVRDGWLMVGSSEDAVLLSLATAAGEHANVRKNKRLMSEALTSTGPINAITFTDHRGTAEEIANVMTGISMAGGFVAMVVPDHEAQRAIMKIFEIVSKLAPVAAKIDFYKSSASVIQSDGKIWRTRGVTNYFSPEQRATAATP